MGYFVLSKSTLQLKTEITEKAENITMCSNYYHTKSEYGYTNSLLNEPMTV